MGCWGAESGDGVVGREWVVGGEAGDAGWIGEGRVSGATAHVREFHQVVGLADG